MTTSKLAHEYDEDALGLARQIEDQSGVAMAQFRLGEVARARGDFVQAQQLLDNAMAAIRDIANTGLEARCYFGRGNLALAEGDLASARVLLAEALHRFHALASRRHAAVTARRLGVTVTVYRLGEHAAGRELLENALTSFRATGDRWQAAMALWELGATARHLCEGSSGRDRWFVFTEKATAEQVAGGFRLTGRCTTASGCHYADWIRASAALTRDGAPLLRADGTPETRIFHLRLSECQILDTWHTAGLRGTGRPDVLFEQVCAPDRRSLRLVLTGKAQPGALAYRDLSTRARPLIAAVALGIARAAIASFRRMFDDWCTLDSRRQFRVADSLSRAAARVRAARAYLVASVSDLRDLKDWSADMSASRHTDVQLASAHVVHSAVEAVDLLYDAAGSSVMYAGNRLERCFRDIHVLNHHVGVASSNFKELGQELLGQGYTCRGSGE